MNPIKHVAIIMDGNGRWGIKNKGSRNLGHRAGLKTIESIIEESVIQKINHLTLYTFSTENWKRPKKEVIFLFSLLESFLSKKMDNLMKNQIKLKIIGNKKKFSNKLQKLLNLSEKKTYKNKKLQVNLALNYGSKEELLNAVKIIKKKKKIN
jgi:undecaprenyl diphosphate synthase